MSSIVFLARPPLATGRAPGWSPIFTPVYVIWHILFFATIMALISQYDPVRVIGAGGFGRALLVIRKLDNQRLVLKEVSLDALSSDPKLAEMARQEAELLSQFSHPNILRIFKYFEEKGCLYLELEFCDGGDLSKAIERQKGVYFAETLLQDWFSQLVTTLAYLHSINVLHRDIKAENVFLVDESRTIKLADFGIAKILSTTGQMATTRIGTCTHFSPEFCEDEPYSAASEVWALGVLLYHLAALQLPFLGANELQIYKKILRGVRDPIPSDAFSPDLLSLIDRMLATRREDRPTMPEIVADVWLTAAVAELEARRLVEESEVEKTRQRIAELVEPFKEDYWSKLSSPLQPDQAPVLALETPAGVWDILPIDGTGLTLLVTLLGGILAVSNEDVSRVVWRATVAVPESVKAFKALINAVIDVDRSRLLFTFQDIEGIFSVNLNQLSSQSASTPSIPLQQFFAGRLVYPNSREFWGLNIPNGYSTSPAAKSVFPQGLLLCCDQNLKQNIGLWSLGDAVFLAEISFTAEVATTTKFNPYRCAGYFEPTEISSPKSIQLRLAASDHKLSRLHVTRFKLTPKSSKFPQPLNQPPNLVEVVSTLEKPTVLIRGGGGNERSKSVLKSGHVRYPTALIFDAVGRLWLGDSGNSRVVLFSIDIPQEPSKPRKSPPKQTSFKVEQLAEMTTTVMRASWTTGVVPIVDPISRRPMIIVGQMGNVTDRRGIIKFQQSTLPISVLWQSEDEINGGGTPRPDVKTAQQKIN